MRIKILYGVRGRITKERYYPPGEYDFDEGIAKLLIEEYQAIALEKAELGEVENESVMNLAELRKHYKSITGKKAYGAWDAETILAKLVELGHD